MITAHRIHKQGDLQIHLFCDFPRNKAPRTGPRHIWRTDTLCPSFGREKNGRLRSWVEEVLVMATLESHIFCSRTWSTSQFGVGAILALSSFLIQIPHQKEPEMSVGYI
jgi:hypothetical protein